MNLPMLPEPLSTAQLAALALSGLLIGMSKTGLSGLFNCMIPVLAWAFGGKLSSGLVLPMLIMADFFGVGYYHRGADWKALRQLMPGALLGIVLGAWIGWVVSESVFKLLMAGLILLGLAVMLWTERQGMERMPAHPAFAAAAGLLGGIATMIGNAAGPILSVYLLAMRLPKQAFIGTGAWFFLMVNVSKVPFHLWQWHTITLDTFLLNLAALPLIAAGAWAGIRITRRIPERPYRRFVQATTLLSVVLLLR